VRALLRHGADPNSPEDPDPANDGRFITPLIDATRNESRVGIVKLLLEAGANPNQFDDLGMTPLMCAASAGAIGVLNLLVASGANVMAETPNGKTALHFAMTKDNPEIVRCLVQLGLDPTKSSVRGGPSPLQLAQKRAHTAAISVLGELGFG
jgi:ankyrin repeat protein